MRQLREKHPAVRDSHLDYLLFGPTGHLPDTMYYQINVEIARDSALRTNGSGGPSGVEASGFRRMPACSSSKKSGSDM